MKDFLHVIPIFSDNYAYVLVKEDKALVIDPGQSQPILDYLRKHNLILTHILCTHHHSDHISGIDELLHHFPAEVIGPHDGRIPGLKQRVKEGDILDLLGFHFEIIETPGHTKSHIVFYLPEEKILFTGDTVFGAGCGRLFEGTPKQMWDSIQKIKALDDDTKLYFGHEYTLNNLEFALSIEPNNFEVKQRLAKTKELRIKRKPSVPTILAVEKKTNPFLRVDNPSLKQCLHLTNESEVDVFAKLRKLKDSF